ncbi:TRAP transporter small permease subunit [Chloroflexota bacterium]
MKRTVSILENISEWSGKIACWFCISLVLLLTYEVFMRYVLYSPTIFSFEVATMIGVSIGSLGLAYCHLNNGHIRVDVFWRLLSPRGKAISDIIGFVIFFLPVVVTLVWISGKWALWSFVESEVMTKTYLYPPAWPVRAVMLIGMFLFVPQGIAHFLRDIHFVRRNETL